jgi:hypothetical protein
MRRFANFAAWLVLAVCCTFLPAPLVHAQQLVTAQGLICDEAKEVERFISLFQKGDDGNAIARRVNSEVGKPNACGFAQIAFYEGDEVSKVRGVSGPARIVKVTIVAVNLGHGWQPVSDYEQYAAIPIVEQES